MKKTDKNHSTLLRQKAEVLLNTSACNRVSSGAAVPFSEVESLRLIHELEVHQIELELINEELLLGKQQAVLDVEIYQPLRFRTIGIFYTFGGRKNFGA